MGEQETAAEGSVTDVTYINWLLMARAGLTGLEFFTPETNGWRQAHMQARYVILRVMLEAGNGLVELKQIEGDDGKPDLEVLLARDKISTVRICMKKTCFGTGTESHAVGLHRWAKKPLGRSC